MAASLLKRIRDNLHSLGWRDSFWYLLNSIVSKLWHGAAVNSYFIMARPTDHPPQLRPDQATSISVRRVDASDPVLGTIPRPADAITLRIKQGSVCYGAYEGDTMVGFLWLQSGVYCEDEFRCCFELPAGDIAVWSYDVYVNPSHRLGLTFLKLREEVDATLKAEKIKWTVGRISAFNLRSRSSHERLGYKSMGRCIVINIARLQLVFSTFSPFLHISLSEKQIPKFTLRFPT